MELIDLTHALHEGVPTWNGSCGFKKELRMDYPEGCRVYSYKCHGGVGTHMDAPLHFFAEGKGISEIQINSCIAPLYVLDVKDRRHPDLLISAADIIEIEKKQGVINSGFLVIARTGWEEFWDQGEKYRNVDSLGKMHFPGFKADGAQLLVDRGVVGVGIDTLSPDGSNEGFPVHEILLGNDKYILENVAHLDRVPSIGALAIALPIKVKNGVEAPVRLVALIQPIGYKLESLSTW